jgi:hypothetical protein
MMETRNNNSPSNSPSKNNSPSNSPSNSPNKSRKDSSNSGSNNNITMMSRVRLLTVGFLLGVLVARPLLMLDCMSNTAALPESYVVHTTFDPPVQTASSTSASSSSAGTTRAAETTTTAAAASSMDAVTVIREFETQPRVVIATKIHGPPHIPQLKQSLCLLMAAYNNRVLYDIVIFTTTSVSKLDEIHLQEIVHPAHLSIQTDKKTLNQHVNELSLEQKRILYQRCNFTENSGAEPLAWGTRACGEDGVGMCMPLAYSWQSEFRAKHIWKHSALAKYKYMLWYDSDAMATRVWEQDPITVMIRNDLAIFFDHFPQGGTRGQEVQDKIQQAYNDTLCDLKLQKGHLVRGVGNCHAVPQIHGFFHITDLDFYRSPENLKWYDIMIGDGKFSRRWDDQLAVTVPAAMRAPERSWEMGANGVKLDVWHNGTYEATA